MRRPRLSGAAVSLFAYDTETHEVSEVLRNRGLDFKSADAGPGAIVYEQFGSLHLYDLKSKQDKTVNVRLPGEAIHDDVKHGAFRALAGGRHQNLVQRVVLHRPFSRNRDMRLTGIRCDSLKLRYSPIYR